MLVKDLICQENPQESIGSIVAIHCHPFFKETHKDLIHVGGEATMIPPLMMIAEILQEKGVSYEPHSGFQVSCAKTYQCKCIWYSLKTHKFEDQWFSSKVLKLVENYSDSTLWVTPKHGDVLVLKTGIIELGKKKTTFNQTSKGGDSFHSISGLLSFSSPTLLAVGTEKYEVKEPLIDSKTGERKRWISQKHIKCRWFNPSSDKFSEDSLPIEILTPALKVGRDKISKLEEAISSKSLLTFSFELYGFKRTLLKPLGINYKGAHYFLEVKDLLLNKTIELLIDDNLNQFGIGKEHLDSLPSFKALDDEKSSYERLDLSKDNFVLLLAKHPDKLLRIKYENLQGVITERTIHKPSVFSIKRTVQTRRGEKEVEINYVRANCLLRNNEERFFRLDRITRVQVLNL